jgi:accessory gene regulator B
MFDQLTKRIIKKMIIGGIVDSEEEEIYQYGLERLLVYSSLMLAILFISFLFNCLYLFPYIIFYFISLRSLLGGIHFDNEKKCFGISILYIVSVIIFYHSLMYTSVFGRKGIFSISMIQFFLTFYLPILDHPNKKINLSERKYFKVLINRVIFLQMVITVICFFFKIDSFLYFSVAYYSFFYVSWILGLIIK